MVRALQVKDFPNYYVTDNGEIYNRNYNNTGRFHKIQSSLTKDGYKQVHLCKNNKPVNNSTKAYLGLIFCPQYLHLPLKNR
mgnify:CR=1 FL=1